MSIDWNGKLHVHCSKPRDGLFWIVTEECGAYEVAFDREASWWTRQDVYSRQDGEPGSWTDDEISGWTFSREDAEEAAELFARFVA